MEKVNHAGQNLSRGVGKIAILICLSAGLAASALSQPADQSLEYQVKAAFLLNFTKFIDWPSRNAVDSRAPIAICIFGKDPFGRALDEIVQGEAISGRPLLIERVSQLPAPQGCQIVFFASAEKDTATSLGGLGPGILTVGEGEKFAKTGGMIAFVIENRHVRFDVNLTAAQNAGLKLSSKLLSVARSVEK